MNDCDVWQNYPNYRKWFNKLYVAQLLRYHSGPCGVAPERDGWYIVRPIYNLSGMSLGAEKKFIKSNDISQVPPGYFWCEWFDGTHYSATYTFEHETNPYWKMKSCWIGEKEGLTFTKWKRSESAPIVPRELNPLSSFLINVEFIGDKVVEVHLRDTPDPDYDEMIPIWEDDPVSLVDSYEKMGYNFISSYDNADSFLKPARLGFMVKNNGNTN
jgi:hypothetical protein